jgi:hypothetical protein
MINMMGRKGIGWLDGGVIIRIRGLRWIIVLTPFPWFVWDEMGY